MTPDRRNTLGILECDRTTQTTFLRNVNLLVTQVRLYNYNFRKNNKKQAITNWEDFVIR